MPHQVSAAVVQIEKHLNIIAAQLGLSKSISVVPVDVLPSGLRITFEVKTSIPSVKIHGLMEVLIRHISNHSVNEPGLENGRITYVNETGNTFHFWAD